VGQQKRNQVRNFFRGHPVASTSTVTVHRPNGQQTFVCLLSHALRFGLNQPFVFFFQTADKGLQGTCRHNADNQGIKIALAKGIVMGFRRNSESLSHFLVCLFVYLYIFVPKNMLQACLTFGEMKCCTTGAGNLFVGLL